MSNPEKNQKAWLGIVFVVLGTVFLLNNLDLIPSFIPYYLFGWETLLVLIGGAMLATGRREGVIFLGIGVFFLLPDVFDLPRFRMRDWWPLILIIIGVVIFTRRRSIGHEATEEFNSDYFEDISIFGGSEKSFSSKNFTGGKITAIFGGSEINFRDAELNDSGEAVLDLLVLFGGSEVYLPDDWTVVNDSFVLFGGNTDNRPKSTIKDPTKVLRIKGLIMFGGNDIK